jgi:hypothetical protein
LTDAADWVPTEVDVRRANVARVYDYWRAVRFLVAAGSPADMPADPTRFQCLVGVGRKP